MKRHKFFLNKHPKNLLKEESKLTNICLHYLKALSKKQNPSLYFSLKLYHKANYEPISKVKTYCLITGRTRYTIKSSNTSRHIFFEYCREGFLTGFFFAS